MKKLIKCDFKSLILIGSIGVFLISLTQKCFYTTGSCGDSIAVVFSGAIGVFLGGAGLSWFANPLLLTSWLVVHKNPTLSLITSFSAAIISLSFLFFSRIMIDEAGNYGQILSYKLGYWLWVLSSFIMLIGNLWLYLIRTTANK